MDAQSITPNGDVMNADFLGATLEHGGTFAGARLLILISSPYLTALLAQLDALADDA